MKFTNAYDVSAIVEFVQILEDCPLVKRESVQFPRNVCALWYDEDKHVSRIYIRLSKMKM